MFAISGVVLFVASVRAQRVSRTAVSVDVMVTVAALLLAPIFQPVDPSQPWIDWPLFVAFLVAAEARLRPAGVIGTTRMEVSSRSPVTNERERPPDDR